MEVVDAKDSRIPETRLLGFRSFDHDKGPAWNTGVDNILVALNIVGCIVDPHFTVLIQKVIHNDDLIAILIRKVAFPSIKRAFSDASKNVIFERRYEVLQRNQEG